MDTQTQNTTFQPHDASESEVDFAGLLKKSFRPTTEERRIAVEDSVRTLSEWALRNTQLLPDDTVEAIRALIAEIDRMLSDQVNEILHSEQFLKVESAWRGLHFLVSRSEINDLLKVKVLQISKTELRNILRKFKGAAWDTSPLFRQIYEQEFGVLVPEEKLHRLRTVADATQCICELAEEQVA